MYGLLIIELIVILLLLYLFSSPYFEFTGRGFHIYQKMFVLPQQHCKIIFHVAICDPISNSGRNYRYTLNNNIELCIQ